MSADSNATDLHRIHSDLEAAISGFMNNEANAIRADMYEEALRFQAAIPHLQEALGSIELAIAVAGAGGAD